MPSTSDTIRSWGPSGLRSVLSRSLTGRCPKPLLKAWVLGMTAWRESRFQTWGSVAGLPRSFRSEILLSCRRNATSRRRTRANPKSIRETSLEQKWGAITSTNLEIDWRYWCLWASGVYSLGGPSSVFLAGAGHAWVFLCAWVIPGFLTISFVSLHPSIRPFNPTFTIPVLRPYSDYLSEERWYLGISLY